jgi:hypothetical protein
MKERKKERKKEKERKGFILKSYHNQRRTNQLDNSHFGGNNPLKKKK